ncbi:MAG: thioredoxin domain-containing protein, partial [Thermoanaerobaculia bacterium]|nr:thioredoxin domain-containing protein [Thermoanaerobaculia bacterium]
IEEVLGEKDARLFSALYDVSDRGNWEGKNILHLPRDLDSVAAELDVDPLELEEVARRGRQALLERRETRVRPGRDEKILAGWNGWMLAGIAEAAVAFRSDRYVEVTRSNADFLIDTFFEKGRLKRSFKDGRVRFDGVLEDYGGVAWGLLAAFEATAEERFLRVARELIATVRERFADDENGAFFDVSDDHEELITRPKEIMDNATPSGNATVIHSMLRLARYLDDREMEDEALDAARALWPVAMRYPSGFGFLLGTAEWFVTTPVELVVSGSPDRDEHGRFLQAIGESYLPQRVLISDASVELPLSEGRRDGGPALYVCELGSCRAPITDPDEAREAL